MPNIEVPLTYTATEGEQPRSVMLVAAVNADGTPIAGGGGGTGGEVTVTNFPATQPVSGPLTNAQLTAQALATQATVAAILAELQNQTTILNAIATNTTPAG